MMTAEQLKVSIYLLLFSGKLTEQLVGDGTAKEILKRIEKKYPVDKKAMRIIKKENGDYYEVAGSKETCITDELLFDIPDSWAWVHLNEIAVSGLGKTLNKSKDAGDTKQYLCSINVYWDGIHLDEIKEAKFSESDIEKYRLMKGDLLICEGGDAGRTAIWEYENEMYYQNALHRVRFWEEIDPYYFRTLFEFYKLNGTIDSYCKGMTIKHLVQGSLNAMRFPLPPLAEQKRIVAKIEELMPFVEQYAAASTKLNTLNTTFPDMMKKSILQEAVQGKLVPQDPNDEPASVLLKKIVEEKKKLIKEGKFKRDKKESVIFRGEDGQFYETKGKNTVCIQDQIPFNIPSTWEWIRLRSYGQFSSGKTPSMSNPKNWTGNIPWVSPKDMKTDIILDSQMHISEDACTEMTLYPSGTLLMVVRSGILKRKLPLCILGVDSTINQDLKAFSFYNNELSEWINYELRGFEHYILHNLVKNVTTVDSLKFEEFQDLLVPLPPRNEQLRIINKIKEIMSDINALSKG